MKCTTAFVAGLGLLASNIPAGALDFALHQTDAQQVIAMSGDFAEGDADRFAAFWDETALDAGDVIVALDSRGGSFGEAMAFGAYFRDMGLATTVARLAPERTAAPDAEVGNGEPECLSACALAFMGGVDREVPADARIGFTPAPADTPVQAQRVAAYVSDYLQDMGAAQPLLDRLSEMRAGEVFAPAAEDHADLGLRSPNVFGAFTLTPDDVATASAPLRDLSRQRVGRIETFCWNGRPMVNLYAANEQLQLDQTMATRSTTRLGGFRVETLRGVEDYATTRLRLYPRSTLLATLILDRETAKALGTGDARIDVTSTSALGVFFGGSITAPEGGDPAIAASYAECT